MKDNFYYQESFVITENDLQVLVECASNEIRNWKNTHDVNMWFCKNITRDNWYTNRVLVLWGIGHMSYEISQKMYKYMLDYANELKNIYPDLK